MFANITYYKLRAGKHFGTISLAWEIKALIIPRVRHGWKTMGKEPKFVSRMGLHRSQHQGGTMANAMQSDLPNMVQDVMQANHPNGASSVDESCYMFCSQSEALKLGRQI